MSVAEAICIIADTAKPTTLHGNTKHSDDPGFAWMVPDKTLISTTASRLAQGIQSFDVTWPEAAFSRKNNNMHVSNTPVDHAAAAAAAAAANRPHTTATTGEASQSLPSQSAPVPGSTGRSFGHQLVADARLNEWADSYAKSFNDKHVYDKVYAQLKAENPELGDSHVEKEGQMERQRLGVLLSKLPLKTSSALEDLRPGDIMVTLGGPRDQLSASRKITYDKQSAAHNGILPEVHQGNLDIVHNSIFIKDKEMKIEGHPWAALENGKVPADKNIGSHIVEGRADNGNIMRAQPAFFNKGEHGFVMVFRPTNSAMAEFAAVNARAWAAEANVPYKIKELSTSIAPDTITNPDNPETRIINPKAGSIKLMNSDFSRVVGLGIDAFDTDPSTIKSEGISCSTLVAKVLVSTRINQLNAEESARLNSDPKTVGEQPDLNEVMKKLDGVYAIDPKNISPSTMLHLMLTEQNDEGNPQFQYVGNYKNEAPPEVEEMPPPNLDKYDWNPKRAPAATGNT